MKPQTKQVLEHLRTFGNITHLRAEGDYGITRVASRIGELEAEGFVINHETVRGVNRFGTPVHFTRYSLEEE